MKKLLYFIIVLIVLIYILAEFIGDSIIKSSLEENLSKNLDRQVSIESLDISYLSGEAKLENIKINPLHSRFYQVKKPFFNRQCL